MIIDGQIPILQMDMASQVKGMKIQDVNDGAKATLINGMTLLFKPLNVNSRIVITFSGNMSYQDGTKHGNSSVWLTQEVQEKESALTEIGPIRSDGNNNLRFNGLSTTHDLDIQNKDPILFRIRANGKNDERCIELVNYDFWYLQVQEFKF